MSLANLSKKGPRSGLSSDDSLIRAFSGGDFFLAEPRSGEGLAREVEGEGDGGRRVAGELDLGSDLMVSGRIGVWGGSSGTAIRSGGASGGVLRDTKPGIFLGRELESEAKKVEVEQILIARERELRGGN